MAGMFTSARPLAPFVPASAPANRRVGRRCNIAVLAKANDSQNVIAETTNRRAILGATLAAAAAGVLFSGPAQARGNAVFSPVQRSKELAEKEAKRKAELKEKYAKLRQEGTQTVSSE